MAYKEATWKSVHCSQHNMQDWMFFTNKAWNMGVSCDAHYIHAYHNTSFNHNMESKFLTTYLPIGRQPFYIFAFFVRARQQSNKAVTINILWCTLFTSHVSFSGLSLLSYNSVRYIIHITNKKKFACRNCQAS